MSKVIEKWMAKHEDKHGPYAVWAGFEDEIGAIGNERIGDMYDSQDIYTKIELFSFVVELLDREANS